jgi:hypothetical protein
MTERNSSSSGTTRGTERGSTAATSSGGGRTTVQQNKPQGTEAGKPAAGPGSFGSQPHSGSDESGSSSTGLAGKVREQANARLSSQKDRALDGVGGVTDAVRKTTQSLREQKHDTVARYVEQAADQVDRVTRNLKNKDVRELMEDAQRLARRQPALFVGSAFALGLLGARFLKSSSPDYRTGEYGSFGSGQGESRYGSADYRRALPSAGTSGPSRSAGPGTSSTNYPGTERY